jgi:hypothetical protein
MYRYSYILPSFDKTSLILARNIKLDDKRVCMERHRTLELRHFAYVRRDVLNITISQRFNESLHCEGKIQWRVRMSSG